MTSEKKSIKRALLLSLLLLSLRSSSQSIDSAWMNAYLLQGYYQDTGTYLPDVPLFDKAGVSTSLKSYRGKLVYIDFWASWCGNCLIRFPYAVQLRNRLAVLGLDTLIRFVNINVDDTPKQRRKALKKYHPEGTNLYAGDTSIITVWNINAIPRYILLDTSGRVLAKNVASPDDSSVDYILYASSKGVHPVQALWKQFEQNKLMEQYHTPDAFTDKDYREWYNKTVPSLFQYHLWRQHQQQSSR